MQPVLDKEVNLRMQSWEEQWTGDVAGVVVSSEKIAELEAAKSEQRITRHEEDYLQILRNQRE